MFVTFSKDTVYFFNRQLGGKTSAVLIASMLKLFDNKREFQVTWKYFLSCLPPGAGA